MLTARRALNLSAKSSPEMPRIRELEAHYRKGVRFRQGEVVMVAGRSGHQKSGFALWLAANWNLPTLYLSADMSGFTASTRLACMRRRQTTEMVEDLMKTPAMAAEVMASIADLQITFSFSNPITFPGVQTELDAFVELHGEFPSLIVVDNLMDVDGCDSSYEGQQFAMGELTALARNTGATVLILHHATDKGLKASADPYSPPSRSEIKNGMSEKPELTLTVALNPNNLQYRVACVKQRMGPSDQSGDSYITLQCIPDQTRFAPYDFRSAA